MWRFFPPSCMCIRWTRVGFSWKWGFRTAVSYKSSYKPYIMKYDVWCLWHFCHTKQPISFMRCLIAPKNPSFCHLIHRGWNFNLWCNGNKLKLETRPTSNIFQHLEWLEHLWNWLPNIWKQSHCIHSLQVAEMIGHAYALCLAVQTSLANWRWCTRAKADWTCITGVLSVLQHYMCLLFVVYGHRSNCRHPKIYLNLYRYFFTAYIYLLRVSTSSPDSPRLGEVDVSPSHGTDCQLMVMA